MHDIAHLSAVTSDLLASGVALCRGRRRHRKIVAVGQRQDDTRAQGGRRCLVFDNMPFRKGERALHLSGVGDLRKEEGPAPSHGQHTKSRSPARLTEAFGTQKVRR